MLAARIAADRGEQARSYQQLHRVVVGESPRLTDAGKRRLSALSSPQRIGSLPAKEIAELSGELVKISKERLKSPFQRMPAGRPTDCTKEVGYGRGQDMVGCDDKKAFSASGLYRNCDWPLKYYTTCIRQQGGRGTCSSFGSVAAVEAWVAKNEGRWVNLSEQDLYKQQRLDWFPLPYYYGDGGSPPLSFFEQLLTGYRFPYERDWDYNPSYKRIEDDANKVYRRSGDDYRGLAWSDTNHQAAAVQKIVETKTVKTVVEEVCSVVEKVPLIGGLIRDYVCEPVEKVIEIVDRYVVTVYETEVPGTSGYRVTGRDLLWSFGVQDAQIDKARAYLSCGVPLVYCFDVPDSFSSASIGADGFVPWSGREQPTDGGHCVMVSGFVANEDLPRSFTPGAGGGYFIIKNSWGTSFGDAGLCYACVDWMKAYGQCFFAVTEVRR